MELSVAFPQPGDKGIQKLGICRNGAAGLYQVGKRALVCS